jgi:uncharacterized protein YbjQ (UPF0145 family)
LVLTEDGLRLGGKQPQQWAWTDIASIDFPNSFSIRIASVNSDPVQIGFSNREEQREFATRYTELASHSEGPAGHLSVPRVAPQSISFPLLSIHEVPGRVLTDALGLVTAQCVMSRGAFSDAGSDLKSIFGGNLAGMEKAISNAITSVRADLVREARALGADAVLGVTVSLASVADKAEAVLASGTAVRTAPVPISGPPREA